MTATGDQPGRGGAPDGPAGDASADVPPGGPAGGASADVPPGGPAAAPPDPAAPNPARASAWGRLWRAGAPRATKAQALGALLALALGFALATQVQQTQQGGLERLRQEDLLRVLDDVSQRSARLDTEVRALEVQRDQLRSGAGTSATALQQAQRRLDSLRILAGTAPAEGPGIRVTITDPKQKVSAPILLDLLQELRDAGAEVVQLGATRMVAGSYFASTGAQVSVDGQVLSRPFVILAIGDSQTLASAMNIPGGIVETVRRLDGTARVEQVPSVRIDAVQAPRTPRFAQPAPEPTPTRAAQ